MVAGGEHLVSDLGLSGRSNQKLRSARHLQQQARLGSGHDAPVAGLVLRTLLPSGLAPRQPCRSRTPRAAALIILLRRRATASSIFKSQLQRDANLAGCSAAAKQLAPGKG